MISFYKVIGAGVLLISFMECHAQVKQVLSAPNRSNTAAAQTYVGLGSIPSSDVNFRIDGSPYFNDEFVKGTIYHNRSIYRDVEMRYDIYFDRIEFKNQDTVMVAGPDKLISKVQMGDQTFIVSIFKSKDKPALTYFLREDSGKMTLLTKMEIKFKNQELGKPIQGDIPAKYIRMPDTHYYKIGNGPLIKIQGIKKLIEEIPDHNGEMEQYARKEKISANKPKELKKFSQYYNSLQ
jgi:hypothetical protein